MQTKSTTKIERCIICKRQGVRSFFCPCDLMHGVCDRHEPTDCAWARHHADYVRMVPCEECDRYRPADQMHPHLA